MDQNNRKREPPDPSPEGQPHLKLRALTSSATSIHEEVDPKEAPVLLYQNKAMQIRIKEARMEIQSHEEAVKRFKEKQRLYDETISCVNRTWDQMNDSLRKLLGRIDFNYEGLPPKDPEGTSLTHLLLQTPEPLYEITEFDEALLKRVEGTHSIVMNLVETVEKEHANNERIFSLIKGDPQQIPSVVQERIQKLEQENKQLTTTINKLQATQQQADRNNSYLENQNRSYTQKIDDLQAKIHQLEEELTLVRRKVIKQECPLPVGVIAQPRTTTTTTATTTSTTSTNANGAPTANTQKPKEEPNDGKQQNGQSGPEVAEITALAESRLEEVLKLREERTAMVRDLSKMRDELSHLPLERIVGSEPYKRLERETRTLRENYEREKEYASKLKSEVTQLRDARRKDREAIEKEESNKRRVLDAQVKELQELVSKLRLENTEIQTQVEQRLAQLPSDKYINELKVLVAARDTDVKKLKDEIERLMAANKYLNERKGDKAEETIQLKQIEIDQLQEKIKKLERDIDDYVRKEKSWTSRERDYRIMVDNFQATSKDRRDLHDLRIAERRLRDEVDDLRREKDDIRRMYEKSQRADTMREMEKKYTEDVKKLKEDCDKTVAKANYQIKDLRTQLESKTQEYEIMLSEVDSISKAYEDMQAQSKRLLNELSQKEDVIIQVGSEGMRVKRQLAAASTELREVQERCARVEENCRSQVVEWEAKATENAMKFNKVFDELQGTGLSMEALRREGRDYQQQAAEYKQQIEALEKSSVDVRRRVEDLVVDLEKERSRVSRLEEDRNSLRRKLDRLPKQGSSSSGFNLAEEELRALKKKITCSVCNDRVKDTCISKCFHVFCLDCVQTNLAIRKRRCPSCNLPFSQNDVHSLYGYVE